MPPSDLVLVERVVSCFVSRVDEFVRRPAFHRFYMDEKDFYERNRLMPADVSGELVMMPGQFGVRCYSWRLRYENGHVGGFNLHSEQQHKPRMYYEIELCKPSGYSFQAKHRAVLLRMGFRPVSQTVEKPWSRITTRIGVEWEKGRPLYPTHSWRAQGIATPQQLYHRSGRPIGHYDTIDVGRGGETAGWVRY